MFFLCLIILLSLLFVHILSLICAAHVCAQNKELRPKIDCHGVTLVRPLCGVEPFSELTLRSSFTQHVSCSFEIIFCVAHAHDPIIPLVRALIAQHPDCNARLLIGDDKISSNPKLNSMAKGWYHALYDIVVFTDLNLLLTPDYLQHVLSMFDVQTACVSAPPIGSQPHGFWADVECAMLNSHAARWQYAAAFFGRSFAQGKTLAFNRAHIKGDLMMALAREPAEDAATTKYMRELRAQLRLMSSPYAQPIGPRQLSAYWNRHSRWARLRRATFPHLFALEIVTGAFLPFMLMMGMGFSHGFDLLLGAIIFFGLWYASEYRFIRALGWPISWRSPLAWLVRDLFLPAFYVAAWLKADFVWHGHHMSSAKATEPTTTAQQVS